MSQKYVLAIRCSAGYCPFAICCDLIIPKRPIQFIHIVWVCESMSNANKSSCVIYTFSTFQPFACRNFQMRQEWEDVPGIVSCRLSLLFHLVHWAFLQIEHWRRNYSVHNISYHWVHLHSFMLAQIYETVFFSMVQNIRFCLVVCFP